MANYSKLLGQISKVTSGSRPLSFGRNKRVGSSARSRIKGAVLEVLESRQMLSSATFNPAFATYFKNGVNQNTTNDQTTTLTGGVVESKSASSYRDPYLQFNLGSSPAFAGATINSITLSINGVDDNGGNSVIAPIAVYKVNGTPNRLLTSADPEGTIGGGQAPNYTGETLASETESIGGLTQQTSWPASPTTFTLTSAAGITSSTTGFITLSLNTPNPGGGNNNVTAFEVSGSNANAVPVLTVNYTAAAVPAAPTGVSASPGPNEALVTWTAPVGAVSYNIYRSTTSGGEGSTPVATGITGTSYVDNAPQNGTTYYYTVAAVNAVGTGAQSAESNSVTPSNILAGPPTGVTVTPTSGPAAVVSWTAPASFPYATGYNVLRSPDNNNDYVQVNSSLVSGTTYTDSTVTAGSTYYYEVQSVDGSNLTGSSAISTPVSATILIPVTIPDYSFETPVAATSNVTYNPNLSPAWTLQAGGGYSVLASTIAGVDTWAVNQGNQAIFIAQDSTLGDTYIQSASLGTIQPGTYTLSAFLGTGNSGNNDTKYDMRLYAGSTIVADTGLIGFTSVTGIKYNPATYEATLTFNNTSYATGNLSIWIGGVQQSLSVDNVQLTLLPGTLQAPAAPTGLTAVPADHQVTLSWNASAGATSYNVYQGTSSGGETLLSSGTNVTSLTFTSTGLTDNTPYYYEVTAVNGAGEGSRSSEVTATPQAASPQTPTGLAAKLLNNTTAGSTAVGSPSAVQLNWTEAAVPPATGYAVFRQNASTGSFNFLANVSGGSNTAFTDTTVAANTSYAYEIEASNASGLSQPSSQTSITTVNYVGITNPSFESPSPIGQYNPTVTGWTITDSSGLANGGASIPANISPWAVTDGNQAIVLVGSGSANPASPSSATSASEGSVAPGVYTLYADITSNQLANRQPAYDLQFLLNGVVVADSGEQAVQAANASSGIANSNLTQNLTFTNTTYDTGSLSIRLEALDNEQNNNTATVGFDNVRLTYTAGTLSVPANPTNLTATAGSNEVVLNWTGSAGADGYTILRSSGTGGSGHETFLANVSGGSTVTYDDTNSVQNGTVYYYEVEAYNSQGAGSPSNEASATPQVTVTAAPTNVTAAQENSTGGVAPILVTWTGPSLPSATSFIILRSSGGAYAQIGTSTTTSYEDSNSLVENAVYTYEVEGVDAAPGTSAASAPSNSVTAYAVVPVPGYSFENPTLAQNGQYNPVFTDASGNPAWTYTGGGPVEIGAAADGYGYAVSDGSQAAVIPAGGDGSYLTSVPLATVTAGTYTLSVFCSTNNAGANDTGFDLQLLDNGTIVADTGPQLFSNLTGMYYRSVGYTGTLSYTPATADIGGHLSIRLLGATSSQRVGFDNVRLSTTGTYAAIVAAPAWLNALSGASYTWSKSAETLTVTSGTVTIISDPAESSDLPVITVGTGANLIVNTQASAGGDGSLDVHLGGLTLGSGATASVVSLGGARTATNHLALVIGSAGATTAPTFSLASTSTLDLSDNDLVIHDGSLSAVNTLVGTGFNNGNWNGAGGIVSSAASASSSKLNALAVAQPASSNTFQGEPVGTTDVVVRYSYYGDATADGHVDSSDYTKIDAGYLSKLTGWSNGDFNFDGVVNGSDYTLIDNAFNTQGASLAAQIATPAAKTSNVFASTPLQAAPASEIAPASDSVEQLLLAKDVVDQLSAAFGG